MFDYNQTKQISETARAKRLKPWESNSIGFTSNYDEKSRSVHLIIEITLDNLLPWIDETFGEIQDPSHASYNVDMAKMEAIKSSFITMLQNSAELQSLVKVFTAKLPPPFKNLAEKLKQQAMTLYFTDPQTLADNICEAINSNF